MKLLETSVGIPAFNEEKNIGVLLKAILAQQPGEYLLTEILVVSDGSSDKTVDIAKSVNSPLVRVIDRRERLGAAETQNEILDNYKADVLVMFDADILPEKDYLARIIQPFYSGRKIGIISNLGLPLPAVNFFGAILNFGTGLKMEMVQQINSGDNVYNCRGQSRAFSRAFTDVFRWKPVVSEDAYSYLECKQLGFDFLYLPGAKIYFNNPRNFKDHLKQSRRFFNGQRDLAKYLNEANVKQAHAIPFRIYFPTVLKNILFHPILTLGYLLVLVASGSYSLATKTAEVIWEPAASSK